MNRLRSGVLALPALAAAVLLSAAGCGEQADGPSRPGPPSPEEARFDAQRAVRDLRAQVSLGPRPAGSAANRRLTALLARRLRAAGATDVAIQRPHRNVVGTIPGTAEGVVVIGAHHDTKGGIPGFVGANDGASGVAVVLELARALPRRPPGASIHLVLFDAEEARGERPFEEDGSRGSRQYVRYAATGGRQGSPPLRDLQAMVLFDMVGDCELEIPREQGSSPALYAAFERAGAEQAEAGGPPSPFGGEVPAVLDDHVPFAEAGVPSLNAIDFVYGPGPRPGSYWHTPQDTLQRVCADSLAAVGRSALLALPRIADRP